MFYYEVRINNGVEAFGVDSKTITVSEVTRNVDEKALAREVSHFNPLVPEHVVGGVMQSEAEAWVHFLAQGNAIQVKAGNDVIMRIYADVKIKGGNINLARAREIMPDEVVTEQDMVDHAGELVSRAGLEVKAHVEVEKKFTDLLIDASSGFERVAIVERPRIMRKESTGDSTPGGGSGTTPGGGSGTTPGGGSGGDSGGGSGGGGNDDNPDGIE